MDLTQNKFTEFKQDYDIYGTHATLDKYHNEQLIKDNEAKATIHTMWTPVTDAASVQEYGAAVSSMLQAVIYGDATIDEHDRITIRGRDYEVVSIKYWNTHRLIRVNLVGGAR